MKPLVLLIIVSLLAAGALAGCGVAEVASTKGSQPAGDQSAPPVELSEEQQDSIVDIEAKTPDEKSAAFEALRHAEDANAGSVFKAVEIKVVDGWAHVAVEESGVPAEEAVGFRVYLHVREDGGWDVAETGTSVSSDDLPGAPPEIFED